MKNQTNQELMDTIRKIRESYENDLLFCGVIYDEIDYDKLADARETHDKRVEKLFVQIQMETKDLPLT